MKTVLLIIAVVLSAAGAFVSDKLLAKHMRDPDAPQWINALCESGDSSNISCDRVLSSRWGMFPPLPVEGKTDEQGRLPVAYLGMAYFSSLLAWFLAVGRANRQGRWWHLVPLLINVAGLCASAVFIWVMSTELKTWCPMCIASHGVNLLLFIVNLLLWPRKPRIVSDADQSAPIVAVEPQHPSFRLAATVIVGIFILAELELHLVSVKVLRRTNSQMASVITEVQSSIQMLVTMHLNETFHEFKFRSDDPVRSKTGAGPVLVIWSDFECEHCRKFEADFESKYRAMFGDHVQLVFRHYPLCADCNPNTKLRVHPLSCTAAEIVEAARAIGGNAKFWEAHDLLFESQKILKDMDVRNVAAKLGLDPEKMATAAASDEVKKRIQEDIEQATSLGINSTPGIYLNGKQVSSLARTIDGFWKQVGFAYHTKTMQEQQQKEGQQ